MYIDLWGHYYKKWVWPTLGCNQGQSSPIVMNLKLDMCHQLNVNTKFYIDISKHVKKNGKRGRTEGQTDGNCQTVSQMGVCNGYGRLDGLYNVVFLAATKQLYDWFSPSVRPSVCLSVCHTFFTIFPSAYHHEIFRSYYHGQRWCPCKRSMSEVKGQGHRGQHPT